MGGLRKMRPGSVVIQATTVGFKAHAALERAGGSARVLTTLSASIYLAARDEIVWLGPEGASLHPRAVLVGAAFMPSPVPESMLAIDVRAARPWTPAEPPLAPNAARAIVAGCHALLTALDALGAPDGFGALLMGARPSFPFDALAARAEALAQACGRDDALGAAEAAKMLLGAGPGLTPAGDDFVGGAFFARALLARASVVDGAAWRAAAVDVLHAARRATHPISAALLGDLMEGHGWAPLHDLVDALTTGAPVGHVLASARRLVAIGHSSGWDILAGVVAGTLGPVARNDGSVSV